MASAFEPGDRVELQGLVSRPELNDLAGTVAGPLVDGRHKVSLDAGGKLVNAKAASLRPRPPPPSSGAVSTTEPAAVHDAHCREDEGRLFHLVLDLTRFYANERVRLCQLDGPEDLGKLRSSPEGMDVLRKLAGAAWTYWMPLPGHDFPGVRARVLQQATQTLAKLAEIEAPPEVPPSLFPYTASAQELMLAEMQKGDAAHWGDSTRRITGSFFAIEQRDGGTVMLRHATPAMTNAAGAVVPARENELYLVAGIAEGIGQMLARRQGLALPAGPLELTLLPYRGRYIYDGLVAGRIRTVPTALLEELVADVRTLEESGQLRVTPPPPTDEQIARLLQQERRARFEAAAEEEDEPAEPLDAETARVMRRMGYTPQENPHNGGAGPIGGPATTDALDPTAPELLRILAERAQAYGSRPRTICTDCAAAVRGMKAALSSIGDIRVEYYAPPSAEECSAATSGHESVAALAEAQQQQQQQRGTG